MKWMRERDLLIAQTMAFVQSVTGKKPDADTAALRSETPAASEASRPFEAPKPIPAAAPMPDIEALLAENPEPPRPAPIARSEQSEIKARVAHFRAHQERFNREREAYCSATMAKVHASLQEPATPPRLGK
jgi:hypothetical protein